MKFNFVESNIDPARALAAEKELENIFVELTLHPDNKSVGSKLGGNERQFLFCMQLNHSLLSARDTDIRINSNSSSIYWGENIFNESRVTIRKKMNHIFHVLDGKEPSFDIIEKMAGEPAEFTFNPDLPSLINLNRICKLTENFARILDEKNSLFGKILWRHIDLSPFINETGTIMGGFPPSMIAFSIRKFIRPSRIARYNLDENAHWPFLYSIQKMVALINNL
jgi:hypothetical protein